MKVGTDGVLLGAWADVSDVKKVLDIGTGTGLVALMIAQRAPDSVTLAIEIDENAAAQASENFKSSKFRERLQLQHVALQDFTFDGFFDLIICNPPFFPSGTPSPDIQRNIARQDDSLDLLTLVQSCSPWMAEHSKLAIILPADRENEITEIASEHEMALLRVCRVKPNHMKEPKRILVELMKASLASQLKEEVLVIEEQERHTYTPEFKKLTADFYPVEYGH